MSYRPTQKSTSNLPPWQRRFFGTIDEGQSTNNKANRAPRCPRIQQTIVRWDDTGTLVTLVKQYSLDRSFMSNKGYKISSYSVQNRCITMGSWGAPANAATRTKVCPDTSNCNEIVCKWGFHICKLQCSFWTRQFFAFLLRICASLQQITKIAAKPQKSFALSFSVSLSAQCMEDGQTIGRNVWSESQLHLRWQGFLWHLTFQSLATASVKTNIQHNHHKAPWNQAWTIGPSSALRTKHTIAAANTPEVSSRAIRLCNSWISASKSWKKRRTNKKDVRHRTWVRIH